MPPSPVIGTRTSGRTSRKLDHKTTLRLEVIEGAGPEVEFKAGGGAGQGEIQRGHTADKFGEDDVRRDSEEDEEKTKKLWEGFRTGLTIDQYQLTPP